MGELIAVDIGNSNTVVGVFKDADLVAHWRVQTNSRRTSDEYALMLRQLFELDGLDFASVGAGIIASVVPTALAAVVRLFERHIAVPFHVVGPGTKTGMQILYEDPREVGADRIVNGVAAIERHPEGCIVVDFGTATTWDVITPKQQYLGGVIAPGIHVSSEALYQRASKLPRVEITKPKQVVGRNTVASMQSGLYYGFAGMVDAVVDRIRAEVSFEPAVIATGGLASLIAEVSTTIQATDELLTLTGLRLLHERNT